jgi:hypothetical protein
MEGAKSCSWYWISIYFISKNLKRFILILMHDKEPFSKIFPAYCLGGPFYVFRPKFNEIPALQKRRRKSERTNIIKIYPPPDLLVLMTRFIHQQTVHTHYCLNHNKNTLPLLHMHTWSHEFIITNLSEKMTKWLLKFIR